MKCQHCPVVEISLGKVKGRVLAEAEGGKVVYLYSSLPFAKPPIGELRFEPPACPDSWDGVLDASMHPPSPQQDVKWLEVGALYRPAVDVPRLLDEDCLYLSVYTANPSQQANLPVLFWIYGGGFDNGGESFYDGSVLASLQEVVVVIPNYRVSVFGFLSLGRETDYTGNMGLFDQLMALKWTRDHIGAFGGNPHNVTIFGESAGAMSVNYHVVSPMSKGLFHRAISHSGSIHMAFPRNTGRIPLELLKKQLNIHDEDNMTLIKKLKSVPANKLVHAMKQLSQKMINFAPVYDGKFFYKDTSALRNEAVVNPVPYIIGCNSTEGHGIMTLEYPKDFKSGITHQVYMEALKGYIGKAACTGLPDAGYDVITEEYRKQTKHDDKHQWSKVYGIIMNDTMFVHPAIKTAVQHNESNGTTYMYLMTQQPSYNHDPAYGPVTARKAPFCECDHGDDIVFTFGLPLCKRKLTFNVKFTNEEKLLSKDWMKYIVNFARNGNPNVGLLVKTKWPQYDATKQEYLSVQNPCFVGKNIGKKSYKFWNEVIEPMRQAITSKL